MTDLVNAYVCCALWSSTDDAGIPLDRDYGIADIDTNTLKEMQRECQAFAALFPEEANLAPKNFGHDFWLTRNRHGAGFWDGGWSEPFAMNATDAAHAAGERWLYVGDDGRIYQA